MNNIVYSLPDSARSTPQILFQWFLRCCERKYGAVEKVLPGVSQGSIGSGPSKPLRYSSFSPEC